MGFNAKEHRAADLAASKNMDVNEGLGQGRFSRAACHPHDPLSEMGQGTLGRFRSGNLGTFMDQAPSGGNVGK